MTEELEIDLEQAKALANDKSKIFVLEQNVGDLEFVQETLDGKNGAESLDIGEAKALVMGLGDDEDLKGLADKYEGAVIVCPHGNTSLRIASALQRMGVRSYSLRKGLAGMRGWG